MERSPIEVPRSIPAVVEARSAAMVRHRSPAVAKSSGRSVLATERRAVRKIRFTAAEWSTVEERARSCGRAPARYVREVALGTVLKVSRTRANAPIIRELGALTLVLQRVSRSLTGAAESAVPEQPSGAEMGQAMAPASVANEIDAVVGGLLAIVRLMGR
jgi:hypothetical protein